MQYYRTNIFEVAWRGEGSGWKRFLYPPISRILIYMYIILLLKLSACSLMESLTIFQNSSVTPFTMFLVDSWDSRSIPFLQHEWMTMCLQYCMYNVVSIHMHNYVQCMLKLTPAKTASRSSHGSTVQSIEVHAVFIYHSYKRCIHTWHRLPKI